jgi:hypothetical protein
MQRAADLLYLLQCGFLGALCDKGLFPEAVWRKAVGDTSGGKHCWPRASSDS